MKISINQLKGYIDIPVDTSELLHLMEDVGLEVKKAERVNEEDIFTLELLANRGDHHSYVGIAQEIHGRTGWVKKSVDIPSISPANDTSLVSVKTDNCLNYVLAEFVKTNADNVELTPAQKRMIELSGNNTVLPVVDVTNFVGIELGQPLHVFDADKIDGKIAVRETVQGEKAKLLFSENYTDLPEGTMVIADDTKILAIAGVMGCEDSKPTEETKRIYLESATFDPVKVRKTAKYLGIQSTSSMRFERGADPALAVVGAQRACAILQQLGWTNNGGIKNSKQWDYEVPSVSIGLDGLNSYYATDYKKDLVIDLLGRYGFTSHAANDQEIKIIVPSHRIWDVKNAKDIYEEVARGFGYNSLPSILPSASGVLPAPSVLRKRNVEDLLVGQGFYEVFTDGFYGDKHRTRLGISEGHPLWDHVRTVNAEDRAFSLLKNNTLTQAVELVQTNLNAKNPNIKAFEWTRTFHPNEKAENGLCEERLVLWAIASGSSRTQSWNEADKKVDVYYMKGLVEELSNMLGIPLEIKQAVDDKDISPIGTCLHPTRRAAIYWNEKMVGVLGEVHPNVLSGWGVKNARPCFIELSQDILEAVPSERRYVPPTSLHPVIRDVCLVLPNGLAAAEVADYMKQQSDWLNDVRITDVFNSESTNFKNAVTFSLEYSLSKAKKEKFTGEEINESTEHIISQTIKKYNEFSLERR